MGECHKSLDIHAREFLKVAQDGAKPTHQVWVKEVEPEGVEKGSAALPIK